MAVLVITVVVLAWIASAIVRTADKRWKERLYRESHSGQVQQVVDTGRSQKEEEKLRKQEFILRQAQEEIDAQSYKVERMRNVLESIELERDACIPGSSNYMKYERKAISLENQIKTAIRKINKAEFDVEEAKRKLGEVI